MRALNWRIKEQGVQIKQACQLDTFPAKLGFTQ